MQLKKFYNFNYNLVNLAGRVTCDPVYKENQNGSLLTFSLAINHGSKRSDGTSKNNTLFIDCKAWNGAADSLEHFLCRGSEIQIIGHLECYKKNEVTKYTVVVEKWLPGPASVLEKSGVLGDNKVDETNDDSQEEYFGLRVGENGNLNIS